MIFGGILITQYDIVNYLKNMDHYTPISSGQLSEDLNLPIRTIRRNLQNLRKSKQIKYFKLYGNYFYLPDL